MEKEGEECGWRGWFSVRTQDLGRYGSSLP